MRTRQSSNQLLVGLALLLVGLLLFLNNLHLIDAGRFWRWLPSVFILLGIWQLYVNDFRFFTGPLILIVGGLLFQLSALGMFGIDSVFDLWPLILIFIGGSILVERLGIELPNLPGRSRDPDRVNALAIFGGLKDEAASEAFEGGELTAIFGGVEADLRQAMVATQPVVINAFALFGGVEIFVPAGWSVRRDVIGIFGGSEDKRRQRPEEVGAPVDLLVTGFALFGSVEVGN